MSWKQLGLSEDFDNEVDDPSSVLEEEKQEEPPTRGQRATRRSAQRKGGVAHPPGPDLRWLRQQRHASALSPGRQQKILTLPQQ